MNNLKKMRKNRGLKQIDVAAAINVTQTTYSRYETGIRKLEQETLVALSKFYNISIDYIVGVIDEPVTLDELQFLKDLKFKTDEEMMATHNIVDDDDKVMSKKDIKKILAILRAYED